MTFSNLVLCIALLTLTLIDDTSCIPLRSCPLGLYCPYGYDCKESSKCVDSCYVINATHQGNDVTGNCEDVLISNDVWLDSLLYEVFVYRKLDHNDILKNISLIVTYGFWDNVSNSGEDISNNVTFRLTSSLNYTQFALNSLSSTFERFQNENIPEIFSRSSIVSSSLQDLTLGDYNMKIQAIFQNRKLAESDVIIHVVDPVPTPLPVPVACVQFDSENYSISSLNLSLTITLTLSGQAQTEPFDVFVIAKDTLSADSNDFTPGWYRATFEPGATNAAANGIPILTNSLDESIEQFSLELYIPGASYKIGIQSGILHKAIANIKDVSEISIAVGEDLIVPESVDVTINCGHLISSISMPFNITWNVVNNSIPNVAVSQDKNHLIIAPTKLNVGGQLGNGGTYTCTICSDNGTCLERHSHCQVCKSTKLNKAAIPITKYSTNAFPNVDCGENLCIGSILPIYIEFTCGLEAVSDDYEVNVYKENTFYTNKLTFELTDHEIMFPNSLGTYKTVLNDSCGMDVATSILSLCDLMIVRFDSMIFTGSESSGNITVSMELIRHPLVNGEISVTIIPSDQSPASALGNGVDYTSTPINATFPAGINSTTVNVAVISDNIVEINEVLQLKIYLPVPTKYAVELGNPSKAFAVIIDSSNCSISFHQSFYNASENTGSVQVELVLSNPVSFDFTVIIHHHDRSAIGGSDYDAGPINITIPAGKIHLVFNITIMNDNTHEEIEWFELYIPTTQDLPDRIHFGENLTTNISIEDNDGMGKSDGW